MLGYCDRCATHIAPGTPLEGKEAHPNVCSDRHIGPKRQRQRNATRVSAVLEEYLLAKEASGRSPGTIDCYRVRLSRLVSFLDDPTVGSITPTDLRRWLIVLKSGRMRPTSGVYVEGHRVVADGFFAWAVREGWLKRSPMVDVLRFRAERPAIRTLTREEILRLLEQQSGTRNGIRNRAALAFLYDTGVRVGELTRMELEDVDLTTRQARIHGKNRSLDTVPLSHALCRELAAYLKHVRSKQGSRGMFFLSQSGGAITSNAIRLWMNRAKRRAGLSGKRVSPHVIRASAATHFAAEGVSAFGVQRFLRHRTASMSARYVDVASIDFARLHAIASPMQRLTMRGRSRPKSEP